MTVKTQMGSPAAAEEGGEASRGGRGESEERRRVRSKSTLESTAPKLRSGSSLSTSKQEEGRRAEGLEKALRHNAWLCIAR